MEESPAEIGVRDSVVGNGETKKSIKGVQQLIGSGINKKWKLSLQRYSKPLSKCLKEVNPNMNMHM